MGLNIFEKLWLIIRGRSDGKRQLFKECDLREYNPAINRKKVYISSFIMTELSGFNKRVISCFGRILCRPEGAPRIMKAQKALEWCDSRINKIDAEINSAISSFAVDVKNVEDLYPTAGEHFDTLRKQRNADILSKCNDAENRLLKEKIEVLSEKSKIMNRMIIRLNVLTAKSYLRSSYYYGQAQKKAPDISVTFMSEGDYVKLCGSSVLNECRETEKKVEQDLKKTKQRIKKVCDMREDLDTDAGDQTDEKSKPAEK